jgi:histidinol-phosphate phosphatase family protein
LTPAVGEAAVFLDRDGTLNRERGFVRSPAELEVLPGVRDALHELRAAGFRLIVLTNQSGIARGLYGQTELAAVHAALHARLGRLPSAWLHCPHHPEAAGHPYGGGCPCRKPGRGLLDQALELFAVDLSRSFLVGDSARDVAIARGTPLRTVLVRSGKDASVELASLEQQQVPVHAVVADLTAAARWILAQPEQIGV